MFELRYCFEKVSLRWWGGGVVGWSWSEISDQSKLSLRLINTVTIRFGNGFRNEYPNNKVYLICRPPKKIMIMDDEEMNQ